MNCIFLAEPMEVSARHLASSAGSTRFLPGKEGLVGATCVFLVEPVEGSAGNSLAAALLAAAHSWETSYFFLVRALECSTRSSSAGNAAAASLWTC
jgi:hypothetical protein